MRVHVKREVPVVVQQDGWALWFQDVKYLHDDGSEEVGYRFIWKDPAGAMRPMRGQARIPGLEVVLQAYEMAKQRGWDQP